MYVNYFDRFVKLDDENAHHRHRPLQKEARRPGGNHPAQGRQYSCAGIPALALLPDKELLRRYNSKKSMKAKSRLDHLIYLRHLALKLPKRKTGPGYQFDEEVELDYYRLQKISEGSINLAEGYAKPLDGPREVGSGEVREEYVTLSRLIDIINERFGSELSEADQLFFDQIAEAACQNESLRKTAEVNSLDKFQLVFRQVLESLFIERMELNEELFTDYMSKPDIQDVVAKWLGNQVYDRLDGSKESFAYPKT
jgi:hypothetical protein